MFDLEFEVTFLKALDLKEGSVKKFFAYIIFFMLL